MPACQETWKTMPSVRQSSPLLLSRNSRQGISHRDPDRPCCRCPRAMVLLHRTGATLALSALWRCSAPGAWESSRAEGSWPGEATAGIRRPQLSVIVLLALLVPLHAQDPDRVMELTPSPRDDALLAARDCAASRRAAESGATRRGPGPAHLQTARRWTAAL